jgi:hypothetical protein
VKKLIQKFGSGVLALLVLFSTMSFTVDKHFCGDILVDQAVFSEAETCGMHASSEDNYEDTCCDELQVSVEGQKELKISFDDLDFNQKVFLASFTYAYVEIFAEEVQDEIRFFQYKPPLLVYDINVLDQTFLI